MKKMNYKQLRYALQRKQTAAIMRRCRAFQMLLCLAALLACLSVSSGASFDDVVDALATSGVTTALVLAPMTDLEKNDSMSAKPKSVKYRIWVARAKDQVDVENFPRADNVTIYTFPLKAGQHWHFLDCRPQSVVPNSASEGDVAPIFTLTVTADILGVSKKTLKFLYDNNGEDFFLIWENCVTGDRFLAGSACSPMKMTVTRLGSDDSFNGATLSFASSCPEPYYYYEGNIVRESPQLIAANATTFSLTANPQYQLGANTAATALASITGVADADVGRIFDILGGGGDNPTTIALGATFILQGGVAWSGVSGASITFEVVKTGTSAYAFYEVARA
jgi:hypothetical protein